MLDIIIISSIIAMPVAIALYGLYLLVQHLKKVIYKTCMSKF